MIEDTEGDTLDREETEAGLEGREGVVPTNSPIGIAHRFTRNPNPITPPPLMGGHMPPAKTRPGNLPFPVAGEEATDRSPTPAADGVTHLPLAQRSQAIPTAATFRREARGDGYVGSGRAPISHVEAEQMEHDNAHEGAAEDGGAPASEQHTAAPPAAAETTTAGKGRKGSGQAAA